MTPTSQFAPRRNCEVSRERDTSRRSYRFELDFRHRPASAPGSAATAATAGMSIMLHAPSTNSTPPPATGDDCDPAHPNPIRHYHLQRGDMRKGSVEACAKGEQQMTPQDLMQAYEEALASQAWKNVDPLMHENICVTFSSGTFKGKDQVRRAFEHNFSVIKDEEYSIENLHWAFVGEESAVCTYSFKWEGLVDGQPSSGGGRGTSVLVNVAGRWQIIAEHLGPHAS